MKLTACHAGDGDCLLVTSSDAQPRRMLVDGGRTASWLAYTREFVAALGKLDVVCVSHIDDDHITGVLRLLEDHVEWRAHEFHLTLDAGAAEPSFVRPPEIGEVWHNGLYRLVGDDVAPQVEEVLGTVAPLLAASSNAKLRDRAAELDDIGTGERASMELSRRLSPEQLGVALNPHTHGNLIRRGDPSADLVNLGKLRLYLLGPSQEHIDALRVKWKSWVDTHKPALKALQAAMLADEDRLGTPAIDAALGDGVGGVSEANVASLMFLVEEGNAGNTKSLLLTGDGVSAEILAGLAHHHKLDANGRIHVDIFKVQHHGAKGNVTTPFVKAVTANHYVFCGNGASDNPEREVVEAFANARLTGIDGAIVGPNTPFKFWFTSAPTTPGLTAGRKAHMTMIKNVVDPLVAAYPRMTAEFLKQGYFEIPL